MIGGIMRHHAGACSAEFILQVFADGRGNAVFFELRVAVVHDVDHVRIEARQFQVQKESVKPSRIVVRQVETGLALLEKVLIELERVAEGRKFLPLGRFHHFSDGVFGVRRRRIRKRVPCNGVLLLEDFGELRVTERVFSDMDAAVGVNQGD